jgi:nitrite reductase (NADH) large subunit
MVAVTCAAPPPGFASTVQSAGHRIDALWRDGLLKQITGFALVGASVLSLVLSLRKRVRWFRLGSFHGARALHTTLGLLAVALLWAHTGLRFGVNLNFALMTAFSGLCLAGGVTGILAFAEGRGSVRWADRSRHFRGRSAWLHVALALPLPALLLFHVLSVYYF